MPDLEERIAVLEAAVTMLTSRLLQSGDISINDARAAHGFPPFPDPEPDFMAHTTTEPLNSTGLTGNPGHLTIRLTHQPTGIEVVARDRAEGIYKLRKALTGAARRQYDLQWKAKVAEARQVGAETPVKRGSDCPEHGGTLLWLGNGDLMCLQGHFYRLPGTPEPATPPRRRRARAKPEGTPGTA